jgi:hypothetical protein
VEKAVIGTLNEIFSSAQSHSTDVNDLCRMSLFQSASCTAFRHFVAQLSSYGYKLDLLANGAAILCVIELKTSNLPKKLKYFMKYMWTVSSSVFGFISR